MSTERIVRAWLRGEAPQRAPEALLSATLERVAATRQDEARGSGVRVIGRRRPTTRLLLIAVVVGGAALGGSLLAGSARFPRPALETVVNARSPEPELPLRVSPTLLEPDNRLGSVAYAVNGSVFLQGTQREPPPAVEIAANEPGGLGYGAPAWSPDGRYLMFTGTSGDASRIFVVDPQGRSVSSFPGWLASWSPDSTRIATWDKPFESVGIWSVDGRLLSSVPFPSGVTLPGDSTPTFTGDGNALYFVLRRVNSEPMAVPLNGSAPHQLSPITTAGNPAFSNDGRQLALPAIDGLFVAPADGSAPRLVAHPAVGRYYDAVWSRANDRIAVAWVGAAPFESLVVIDVATGRTVVAWQATPGAFIRPIRWSPDGLSILAVSGTQLLRVVVTDQPTLNPVFAAGVLVDGATDIGADWQWLADAGRPLTGPR
jgi:hypothetical protein